MKNIKLIVFTTVAGLFLTACGGGSSSSGGSTPPSAAVMVPSCATAFADVTGKTIKKVEDAAEVKIVHSPNSTRTACMIKGQAEII